MENGEIDRTGIFLTSPSGKAEGSPNEKISPSKMKEGCRGGAGSEVSSDL
jgi:hypothetical protein